MPSGLVSICEDSSSITSAAMQVYYKLLAQSVWCLARHYRQNSHSRKIKQAHKESHALFHNAK
jgi:hypothetical protein